MKKTMTFEIWACPVEGCPNYYGSSSARGRDLTAEANHEADLSHGVHSRPASDPRVTGNRGECPDCKARTGIRVQRVLIVLIVDVPDLSPVPPPSADAAAWAAAHS